MKSNLNHLIFLYFCFFLSSCGMNSSRLNSSGINNSVQSESNTGFIISSQKDFDYINTTVTISSCSGIGTYSKLGVAQKISSIQFPTPDASTTSCTISLSQLAYTDTFGDSYTYIPSATALSETFTINEATGATTITSPGTTTSTYNGNSSSSAAGLTTSVTLIATSSSISISWIVNASSSQVNIQTFTSSNTGNAVAPAVTGVSIFNSANNAYNSNAGFYENILYFINNSGTPESTQSYVGASSNTQTIFGARSIYDSVSATAGTRCFLYLDANNSTLFPITFPSWYTYNSTLASDFNAYNPTGFTLASSTGGYNEPLNYADADALVKATQSLINAGTVQASGADPSGNALYYLTSGSVVSGIFNCNSLLSFAPGNWAGPGSQVSTTLTTTGTSSTPNWAEYNWFAILTNDENSASQVQSANAYTMLKIPAVASSSAKYTLDGSPLFFVANRTGGTIAIYSLLQMQQGGTPAPLVTLNVSSPTVMAFDSSNNLWVSTYTNNSILEFTPAQYLAGGSQTPTSTLTSSSFSNPYGISFDSTGALWVANAGNNTIAKFISSNLSGAATPNLTIAGSSTDLSGPEGIAFDSSGDLWILNSSDNHSSDYGSLEEYTASTLNGFGTGAHNTAPNAYIYSTAATNFDYPNELAFDPSGNLWITSTTSAYGTGNIYNGDVNKFTSLTSSTTATAATNIQVSSASLNTPSALTFDSSGNLWVGHSTNGSVSNISEYTSSQLTSGVITPTPNGTVSNPTGFTYINGPSSIVIHTVPYMTP